MNKICTKCQQDKSIEEFTRDVYAPTGYKSSCKQCARIANTEYRTKNPGKSRDKMARWENDNRQYRRLYRKAARGTDESMFVPKKHSGRSREEARAFMRTFKAQYDIDNKTQNAGYHREKRAKHGDAMNARARARAKERRRIDPQYRIMENLRNRLKFVTKKHGTRRFAEYETLFGCSLDVFRRWIESHFEPGMSWTNWGLGDDKWNLDHHYPCAAFDLTDPEQQRQCFHYMNTYPMWCRDNFSKGDRIPDAPRENLLIPVFANL